MEVSLTQLTKGMFGWTAEASSLGIPPGKWPTEITVPELQRTFAVKRVNKDNGDVRSVVYGEHDSGFVTVFND